MNVDLRCAGCAIIIKTSKLCTQLTQIASQLRRFRNITTPCAVQLRELQLLCRAYSHLLSVLDDDSLYISADPMPLDTTRAIVLGLNALVFYSHVPCPQLAAQPGAEPPLPADAGKGGGFRGLKLPKIRFPTASARAAAQDAAAPEGAATEAVPPPVKRTAVQAAALDAAAHVAQALHWRHVRRPLCDGALWLAPWHAACGLKPVRMIWTLENLL